MDIVVGYLDSPEGEAALDRGIEEAKLRDGRLVIVHSMQGGDDDPAHYRRSAAALEKVAERLTGLGVSHSIHEYVRGLTPAEDLMAAVNEHDAGMIVIGIRTRSATGKLILGSNALDILHDATVPVLCVKRS